MTSNLKCPICGKAELTRLFNPLTGEHFEDYYCPFGLCNFSGNKVAVDALTQAKQDLEIARKALEKLNCEYNNCRDEEFEGEDVDWEWWAMAAKNVVVSALEQIEHKEQ